MTEINKVEMRTDHNVRIVNLTTGDQILCLFGEVRNEEEKVIGYRMIFPYTLTLGAPNEDGTMPITYERWCPFSPQEEHRLSGDHIISVVFPDNSILDNYARRLKEQAGLTDDQIFIPQEEVTDGSEGEPAEASE